MDREVTQHTKDFLAQELRAAGLDAMADKAATGYYHDFLSPLAFPETVLLRDLQNAMEDGLKVGADDELVHTLIKRHINGEFDASKEESDAWAASEDGKAAFSALADGVRRCE